jgi:hypothetical protein
MIHYIAKNLQSMFFIIMMRTNMYACASIYCRDCKIITLNTIKNNETCVCLSEKSQTLTIERSSLVNEKKNESLVMNEALEWLLLLLP